MLTVSTAPASPPITTAQMKAYLRVETSEDDTLIASLIQMGREQVEAITHRALFTTTYVEYFDDLPSEFVLQRSPLQSVDSITYVDTFGDTQTLSSSFYRVDTTSMPARITKAYGATWPSVRRITNTVAVTYDAGETDVDDIPARLVQAVRYFVTHAYEHRELVITGTIASKIDANIMENLCWPERVWS